VYSVNTVSVSLCKCGVYMCDGNSQSWYSARILDFSGSGCDEALETGSVLASISAILCNQARRFFVQHAIKQVSRVIRFRRCHLS
jgi:hypothetical protein